METIGFNWERRRGNENEDEEKDDTIASLYNGAVEFN